MASDDGSDLKEQAHTYFENTASYYASEREHDRGFCAQLEIVFRMLGSKGGLILDVGCAAGSEIPALRAREFRVAGVELSEAMLEHARQRFSADPCVAFFRADAESLPFQSESFDRIINLGVLEYLPDYRPALLETWRLLRPGGVAVFSLPSGISPYYVTEWLVDHTLRPPLRLVKRLLGKKPPATRQAPVHAAHRCVPWRFRRQLAECGLIPAEGAFCNFFIYPLDRLWPAGHARSQAYLERFASLSLIGWTACQYVVSARKVS